MKGFKIGGYQEERPSALAPDAQWYRDALKRVEDFKSGDRVVIIKPRYRGDQELENRTLEKWLKEDK